MGRLHGLWPIRNTERNVSILKLARNPSNIGLFLTFHWESYSYICSTYIGTSRTLLIKVSVWWVVILWVLLYRDQRFGETCCLQHRHLQPEYGGSRFLRNVDGCLPKYTESRPSMTVFIVTALRVPHVTNVHNYNHLQFCHTLCFQPDCWRVLH
jgi:hypothetical protein